MREIPEPPHEPVDAKTRNAQFRRRGKKHQFGATVTPDRLSSLGSTGVPPPELPPLAVLHVKGDDVLNSQQVASVQFYTELTPSQQARSLEYIQEDIGLLLRSRGPQHDTDGPKDA